MRQRVLFPEFRRKEVPRFAAHVALVTRMDPRSATVLPYYGTGPRICPGRASALPEMKLVLSMLDKNIEVARVGTSTDVKEVFSSTMMAKGL